MVLHNTDLHTIPVPISTHPGCPSHFIPLSITKSNALLLLCLLTTCVGLTLRTTCDRAHAAYYNGIDTFNGNVMASLDRLYQDDVELSSQRILVAGMRGPFFPFRYRNFIQDRTHLSDGYVVLLRKSEAAWNDQSRHMGASIYAEKLDVNAFDKYVIYDESGTISRILSREAMTAMPSWQRVPTLVCNMNLSIHQIHRGVFGNYCSFPGRCGRECPRLGSCQACRASKLTPVLHYYLGHAYTSTGDISAATRSMSCR